MEDKAVAVEGKRGTISHYIVRAPQQTYGIVTFEDGTKEAVFYKKIKYIETMYHPAERISEKYIGKDLHLIISGLSREIAQFKRINGSLSKHRDKKEYTDWAREFLFFLNTGVTPSSIGIEGLKKFKGIIENLVDKKQLKKEVLTIFD